MSLNNAFLPVDDGFTGGPSGWYKSTGETAISIDGSVAHEYRDPYHPEPIWSPVIGSPTIPIPIPPSLYLVSLPTPEHGSSWFPSPVPPTHPGPPPTLPPASFPGITLQPEHHAACVEAPEPAYTLLLGILMMITVLYMRRRQRVEVIAK
jgi:hypothetical protein